MFPFPYKEFVAVFDLIITGVHLWMQSSELIQNNCPLDLLHNPQIRVTRWMLHFAVLVETQGCGTGGRGGGVGVAWALTLAHLHHFLKWDRS